jgi:hypothetical protein
LRLNFKKYSLPELSAQLIKAPTGRPKAIFNFTPCMADFPEKTKFTYLTFLGTHCYIDILKIYNSFLNKK